LHFYEKANFQFKSTILFDWDKPDATLREFYKAITEFMPQNKIISSIQKHPYAKAVTDLNSRVDSIFSDTPDLYVYWDKDPNYKENKPAPQPKANTVPSKNSGIQPKPQPVTQPEPVPVNTIVEAVPNFYESITKYTFYEASEKTVRVILEIKNIHKHPKELFTSRFFEKSMELKIHDFNGKNYIFAVPRLQYKINPDNCTVVIKEDKLNINLRKANEKDNWHSLYRTKAIGEDDD